MYSTFCLADAAKTNQKENFFVPVVISNEERRQTKEHNRPEILVTDD